MSGTRRPSAPRARFMGTNHPPSTKASGRGSTSPGTGGASRGVCSTSSMNAQALGVGAPVRTPASTRTPACHSSGASEPTWRPVRRLSIRPPQGAGDCPAARPARQTVVPARQPRSRWASVVPVQAGGSAVPGSPRTGRIPIQEPALLPPRRTVSVCRHRADTPGSSPCRHSSRASAQTSSPRRPQRWVPRPGRGRGTPVSWKNPTSCFCSVRRYVPASHAGPLTISSPSSAASHWLTS